MGSNMAISSHSIRRLAKKALNYHPWNSDEDQLRLIPDARVIFDVGANVGQTAKTYRRLFPSAQIWSFEPFPATFASLCRSAPGGSFHPTQIALSDQVTTTTLNLGRFSTTHSLLEGGNTGETIDVATDTVDNFCRSHNIPAIDILKIDVEGAESRVLAGAADMFSQGKVRAVFIEVYFQPAYEGMAMMWDLHAQLNAAGFVLHGLYSLSTTSNERLSFANALYTRGA